MVKNSPRKQSLRVAAKQSRPSRSLGLLRRTAPRNDQLVSRSEAETEKVAARLAKTLRGGEVILLEGELGAGKTVFIRGLAKALGVRERITSPTFVLMRIYRTHIRHSSFAIRHFAHVDAYRLRGPRELVDVGLPEWVGRPDTVVAIEWGERIAPLVRGIPHRSIQIESGARDERRIRIAAHRPPTTQRR